MVTKTKARRQQARAAIANMCITVVEPGAGGGGGGDYGGQGDDAVDGEDQAPAAALPAAAPTVGEGEVCTRPTPVDFLPAFALGGRPEASRAEMSQGLCIRSNFGGDDEQLCSGGRGRGVAGWTVVVWARACRCLQW